MTRSLRDVISLALIRSVSNAALHPCATMIDSVRPPGATSTRRNARTTSPVALYFVIRLGILASRRYTAGTLRRRMFNAGAMGQEVVEINDFVSGLTRNMSKGFHHWNRFLPLSGRAIGQM